jgi:hypothetical protein
MSEGQMEFESAKRHASSNVAILVVEAFGRVRAISKPESMEAAWPPAKTRPGFPQLSVRFADS